MDGSAARSQTPFDRDCYLGQERREKERHRQDRLENALRAEGVFTFDGDQSVLEELLEDDELMKELLEDELMEELEELDDEDIMLLEDDDLRELELRDDDDEEELMELFQLSSRPTRRSSTSRCARTSSS